MTSHQKIALQAKNIATVMHHYAQHYPNRLALSSEDKCYTYNELASEVERLAGVLSRIGVRAGDRIAVLTPPRADSFALFLAINTLDAVWTGFDPRYRQQEMSYIVQDSQPKFIFYVKNFRGRDYTSDIDALYQEHECIVDTIALDEGWSIKDLRLRAPRRQEQALSADTMDRLIRTAFLVYTSGSTGKPKGVLVPNRGVIRRSITQYQQLNMDDFPRIFNALPMNHLGGMVWLSGLPVCNGGTIVFREIFNADDLPHIVEANDINVLHMISSMYTSIFQSPNFKKEKFRSVKWHFFSGSAISREHLYTLWSLGSNVITSYGSTETSSSVTYQIGTTPEELLDTIGSAVPDGEVIVLNNQGTPCQPGEQGEILVRPEFCMLGYFNREEQTKAAYTKDGWLRTGDLAEVKKDGSLRLVGRLSEMYKSGGYNVYPREVEMVLEQHPAISLAAVVGVPDPVFAEVGVAFVIPSTSTRVTADDLLEWCAARLANYKVPKRFEIRTELPLLPVGKADKVLLKAQIIAEQQAFTA